MANAETVLSSALTTTSRSPARAMPDCEASDAPLPRPPVATTPAALSRPSGPPTAPNSANRPGSGHWPGSGRPVRRPRLLPRTPLPSPGRPGCDPAGDVARRPARPVRIRAPGGRLAPVGTRVGTWGWEVAVRMSRTRQLLRPGGARPSGRWTEGSTGEVHDHDVRGAGGQHREPAAGVDHGHARVAGGDGRRVARGRRAGLRWEADRPEPGRDGPFPERRRRADRRAVRRDQGVAGRVLDRRCERGPGVGDHLPGGGLHRVPDG